MYDNEEMDIWQSFSDMAMALVGGLIVLVLILLLVIGTPKENDDDGIRPGSVVVQIEWTNGEPNGGKDDIDLWVTDPTNIAIGYSHKTDNEALFALLEDDTGLNSHNRGPNREFAITSAIIAGWYTVNLHLYALRENKLPIWVQYNIQVLIPKKPVKTVKSSQIKLLGQKEEVTVLRFRLDDKGTVLEQNTLNRRVRNAGSPQ